MLGELHTLVEGKINWIIQGFVVFLLLLDHLRGKSLIMSRPLVILDLHSLSVCFFIFILIIGITTVELLFILLLFAEFSMGDLGPLFGEVDNSDCIFGKSSFT